MTKLEELKAAYDAAFEVALANPEGWDLDGPSDGDFYAARNAYLDELKKDKGDG